MAIRRLEDWLNLEHLHQGLHKGPYLWRFWGRHYAWLPLETENVPLPLLVPIVLGGAPRPSRTFADHRVERFHSTKQFSPWKPKTHGHICGRSGNAQRKCPKTNPSLVSFFGFFWLVRPTLRWTASVLLLHTLAAVSAQFSWWLGPLLGDLIVAPCFFCLFMGL